MCTVILVPNWPNLTAGVRLLYQLWQMRETWSGVSSKTVESHQTISRKFVITAGVIVEFRFKMSNAHFQMTTVANCHFKSLLTLCVQKYFRNPINQKMLVVLLLFSWCVTFWQTISHLQFKAFYLKQCKMSFEVKLKKLNWRWKHSKQSFKIWM